MWRKEGTFGPRCDADRPKTVQADDHASFACPVSLIQRAYRRRCALYAPVTREFRDRPSGVRGPHRQKIEDGRTEGREASKADQECVKTSSEAGIGCQTLLNGRQKAVRNHRLTEGMADRGEEAADFLDVEAGDNDDVLERVRIF